MIDSGLPATTSPSRRPTTSASIPDAAGSLRSFTWRDVRLYELVIGLTIGFWRYAVIGGVPGEILVMAFVVGVALFTPARVRFPGLVVIFLVFAAMVGCAVLASVVVGESWQQRALRMMLLIAFAVVVAGGRLDWRSLVVGAVIGLAINAACFYLRLTPDMYPPYLTGWLMDKNVAGLFYAAGGLLALGLCTRWWTRLAVVVSFSGVLWLTGSRTSLGAFVAALVWWLLRNRLNLFLRVVALIAGIQLLLWFEATFSQFGPFSDRTGTDLLRGTIHAAENIKVGETPWYGQGLNTAWVDIKSHPHMWFHDSYAALIVEGGYPMVGVMLVLVGIVGLGLFSRRRVVGEGLRAAEGALIVVLVCAWQLGEVFFTSIAFLALGIAWHERFGVPIAGRAWVRPGVASGR